MKRHTALTLGARSFVGRTANRRTFQQIHHACLAGENGVVIARRNGQRQNAVPMAIKINFCFGGLLFLLSFILLVWIVFGLRVGSGLVTSIASSHRHRPWAVRCFFSSLGLFVVAFGRNRRSTIFCEHHHVRSCRLSAIQRGKVDASVRRTVVCGLDEVEVLAIEVEGGREGIAHSVRDLGGFVRLHRVEEHGPKLVHQVAMISDPFGIRRPDCAPVGTRTPIDPLVNEKRFRRRRFGISRHIDYP